MCTVYCLTEYSDTCWLSAVTSLLSNRILRYMLVVCSDQFTVQQNTQIHVGCLMCTVYCLTEYSDTCWLSDVYSLLSNRILRYMLVVCSDQFTVQQNTQIHVGCLMCTVYCLTEYSDTCWLSDVYSLLSNRILRYMLVV